MLIVSKCRVADYCCCWHCGCRLRCHSCHRRRLLVPVSPINNNYNNNNNNTCTRGYRYWCTVSNAVLLHDSLSAVPIFSFSTEFLNSVGIIFMKDFKKLNNNKKKKKKPLIFPTASQTSSFSSFCTCF